MLILKAENGDEEARFELYQRYLKGDGVEADLQKARHWLRGAVRLGHPLAKKHQEAMWIALSERNGRAPSPAKKSIAPLKVVVFGVIAIVAAYFLYDPVVRYIASQKLLNLYEEQIEREFYRNTNADTGSADFDFDKMEIYLLFGELSYSASGSISYKEDGQDNCVRFTSSATEDYGPISGHPSFLKFSGRC